MVIEPFASWPASNKKAKPAKPAIAQYESWEKAYKAADSGSLDVTPKKSEPVPKPTSPSSQPDLSVTHDDPQTTHPSFTAPQPAIGVASPLDVPRGQSGGQDPTRPVSVFNLPDTGPSPRTNVTPPSPYQLNDPDAASAFVAGTGAGNIVNESQAIRNRSEAEAAFEAATDFVEGTGVGSLLNESEGTRPPVPAYANFEADKEAGKDVPQYNPPTFDGDRATFIHWPESGYFVRNEYVWNEESRAWDNAAVEWGGPGGGGREDLLDPDTNYSTRVQREEARPPHVIMRDDHYDRDGSKQNSYPNSLSPGSFNGPIEPTYDNYPVAPDPVVGAIAGFLGFPFFSPANPEGYSDPVATTAGTFTTITSPSPSAPLTIFAGEALGLANEHRGRPTLEGGIPRSRAQRGNPDPYIR